MSTLSNRINQQEPNMREIISDNLLTAHFQEIISLSRKKIIGMEGLIRGISPSSDTLIPPVLLFEAAEHQNLSLELDRACRDTILKEFAQIHKQNSDLMLFLNLSASILDHAEGSNYLLSQVQQHGIRPRNVVIEISESNVLDSGALCRFGTTYRKLGFMLALDDVGTGFSNMDRILDIKPDIIKIDMALVSGIHDDYHKQGVFKSLVNLANIIGALVIAEGVETQEEAVQILKLGGSMMQGFFYSKPHAPQFETVEQTDSRIQTVIQDFNRQIRTKTKAEQEKNKQVDQLVASCIDELTTVDPHEFDSKLLQITWSFRNIECAYILDNDGIQISNTIRFCEEDDIKDNLIYYSASPGTDHTMEKYYYPMINANLKKYITEPYVSLATGNLCVTVSKIFAAQDGQEYILCLDLNNTEMMEELNSMQEMNVSNLVFNINGKSMTEINRMINKMNEEIIKDSLTNTYNRRYMEERLLVDVFHAHNVGQPISVILADIDLFKNVNDTFGHLAGDHVLKEFARIAKNNIRKSNDWIARYGGEEFLIVLLNADTQAAYRVAEKIRMAIESESIPYRDDHIKITCSFGVYTMKDDNLAYEDLIRQADINLYSAKTNGRNRTVC